MKMNDKNCQTCPECGKTFFVALPKEYVYKRGYVNGERVNKYYCSWSCYRKHELRKEEKTNVKEKETKIV